MGIFVKKNKILDSIGGLDDVTRMSEQVKSFFADQKIDGICSFIRNKFGFHYEHWDEVDGLIENEAKQFTEFEIWLSTEDSGNEIFASTNAVMLKVIFSEMKKLGFTGDDAKLFDDLFELSLRGARILREFTIAYLTGVLSVTWVKTEELEITSPLYSDVKLPLIVAGQP
jgi:hypothetical protein